MDHSHCPPHRPRRANLCALACSAELRWSLCRDTALPVASRGEGHSILPPGPGAASLDPQRQGWHRAGAWGGQPWSLQEGLCWTLSLPAPRATLFLGSGTPKPSLTLCSHHHVLSVTDPLPSS